MFKIQEETTLLPQLIVWKSDMSRNKIKMYLQSGRIFVNGQPTTQFNYPLHPGDVIEIGSAKSARKTFTSKYFKIVYEDRYLVVIDKRDGVLSMSTSHHTFSAKTELDKYLDQSHQKCTSHIVHRLDRETSGLMIFAKSREVQQLFEKDWKGLVFDRRYVAVAEGHLENESGTVTNWLKDTKQFFTFSSPVDNGGKLATTHYQVLEEGPTNSLVELKLDTGRKNQIRVHLSDLNHPVVGDRKYGHGMEEEFSDEENNATKANRLCLHAYRLHFTHPVTQQILRFDAPIPSYFLTLL